MFRKVLRNLKLVNYNFLYFLIATIIAIAITITNTQPLKSQTAANSQSTSPPKEEMVDVAQFSKIVKTLETKWEKDYERYFNRNFSSQSRSARQIATRLKKIRQQRGINPAVIWAMPMDNFLELLLVTPEKQFILKKIRAGKRDSLTPIVEELEAAIADRQSLKYLPPARLLYLWLLKPLEPYLAAENIDTLLFCTGPILRSFPFATLHDGEKFIIEKYNIARIPAFNLTDTSYEPVSERKVLATGASEFANLPSLPGVKIELDTIVPTLWSGRKLLNQDFTIENLKNLHQQGNFDIIHIASHAQFNSGSPEKSYIQFSDRKLSLDGLPDLALDIPQVDLLVLSACNTALGDRDAEFGFAGLAMQAGVKSALASLWSIDDSGTIVLMSEFYQQLKSTPIKAAALRQAQMRMLQQEVFVDGNQIRGSTIEVNLPPSMIPNRYQNLNHPFYWAGFTIIGNPW